MASSCCQAPGQLVEDHDWLAWICSKCGQVLATLDKAPA